MDVYAVMAARLARQYWYGSDLRGGNQCWATTRAESPLVRIVVALVLIGVFIGGLSIAGYATDGSAASGGTLHAELPPLPSAARRS